ncbi:MAG TPA: choice-of-anchor Q domain-containing protein [Paludibacteraceae bacterium]|nr:choice-of-anchor Q domain-containing protein [Paludibacteraceae bacterium]
MKKLTLFAVIFCSLTVLAEQKNGIVYVKPGATGTGASWSDAMGDIQAAINLAKAETTARKDVWVAAGEFTITTCITLVDSVNVYGSFAGTEASIDDRAKVSNGKPWEFVNTTTLKGDGVRHVQAVNAFDMETVVDGFILTNGNGAGSLTSGSGGSAMIRPNVVLQNCIIKNNSATVAGGIMMNNGGTVRNCLIKNNTQITGANGGGGIFCNTSSAGYTAYIENCEITGNISNVRGAGIGVQGNTFTYVSNCKIYNNKSIADDGTTLKPGGGIYANSKYNQIVNCAIYNNTGTNAVYYAGGNFYNNTIVKNVGGFYLAAANASNIINNIVWGCATDVTGSTATSISGVLDATTKVHNNATYNPMPEDKSWELKDNILFSSNVSNGDVPDAAAGTVGSGPKFNHVTHFLGAAATAEEQLQLDSADWSLNYLSPCVDAGENIAAIPAVAVDITGLKRPQGYTPETAKYDMGAYELPYYVVVAGEPALAKGKIYSSLGEELPENYSCSYPQGSKLELLFLPDNGYIIERAYYTISTDGGLTFTGFEVDFTSEIDKDGFWFKNVLNSFKISVEWAPIDALSKINFNKVNFIPCEGGVCIIGLETGEQVTIYSVSGLITKQFKASGKDEVIQLNKGVYVVCIGNKASKLLIK